MDGNNNEDPVNKYERGNLRQVNHDRINSVAHLTEVTRVLLVNTAPGVPGTVPQPPAKGCCLF